MFPAWDILEDPKIKYSKEEEIEAANALPFSGPTLIRLVTLHSIGKIFKIWTGSYAFALTGANVSFWFFYVNINLDQYNVHNLLCQEYNMVRYNSPELYPNIFDYHANR